MISLTKLYLYHFLEAFFFRLDNALGEKSVNCLENREIFNAHKNLKIQQVRCHFCYKIEKLTTLWRMWFFSRCFFNAPIACKSLQSKGFCIFFNIVQNSSFYIHRKLCIVLHRFLH